MTRTLHQFVAGFARNDAISNEAVLFRDLFRSWGYLSEIFCESKRIHPELRKQSGDAEAYARTAAPGDSVLLHLSIGSPVNEIFATLPTRKAILYHNITPSEYFAGINPQIAASLALGRRQLAALSSATPITLADSAFNAAELTAAGYSTPRVLPLMLNLDSLTRTWDRSVAAGLAGRPNIVFVGRCVPNKKIEDVIAVFFAFKRWVCPDARLVLVGSHAGSERYHFWLRALVHDLDLDASVDFAGSVSQPHLNAVYRGASAFLCMSEHEGFCIPLMEAMANDVPVVALAAGAVPETLDGAGILVHEKNHGLIAETLGRLCTDPRLKQAVMASQRARIARYRARDLGAELRDALAPLLAE